VCETQQANMPTKVAFERIYNLEVEDEKEKGESRIDFLLIGFSEP
jgi:hypothetical protein